VSPISRAAAGVMLDDLAWWAAALDAARRAGQRLGAAA
jgi:hypothetical protein